MHRMDRLVRIALTTCAIASLLFGAAQIEAQAPPSGPVAAASTALSRDEILARVRERTASGDTASAVNLLRKATDESRTDAVLWHEYGMLLSAWTKPYWRKSVMPAGIPQRIQAADSALQFAARLAPDSATYAVHYGQHLFNTNQWNLVKATSVQNTALDRAEARGDTLSLAQSSDALGLFMWRRYEPLANRRYPILFLGFTPNDYVLEPHKFQMFIDDATRKYDPPLGDYLYLQSLELFRRARKLDDASELPLRHELMALAERSRWDEVASVARSRIALHPEQKWPWLALGLAEYRRDHGMAAAAAFDSGFARMPREEREHLLSLSRLLPTAKQAWYDSLSGVPRTQLEGVYWSIANPSMLIPGNVLYDEFRARIVHADLMWTNEEMRVRGADSDRGEIMIRWGPPDDISTLDRDVLTWLYRGKGLNFFFNHPPTYGTANLTQFYRTWMLEVNERERPAIWANVPVMRRGIDSLPVQTARFRSSRDSIDVAVFGGIRAGALRTGSPTDTTVLKTGVFSIDARGRVQTRTSDAMRTGERDTLALTARQWHVRVPANVAYLRVEALETDNLRIARVIRDVAGFPTSGFGVSDLLVGTRIIAPSDASTARWRDYTLAPVNGNAIRRGQPLELLWEVYEPTVADNTARYRVSITVQRVEATGVVGVTARVIGGLRNAVTRSSDKNSIAVQYDRTSPGGAVRTEQLRLDLGSARAGRHRLTLEVQDLNSGRLVSQVREIVLVDR